MVLLRRVFDVATLGLIMLGAGRLCLGEWHYSRGMAARDPAVAIYHLSLAGEVYPASFTFRTAQARQLFMLFERNPAIGAKTLTVLRASLAAAVDVDRTAPDLVSMLVVVDRALGRCDLAEITARWLLHLAPRSEKAKTIASTPCGTAHENHP